MPRLGLLCFVSGIFVGFILSSLIYSVSLIEKSTERETNFGLASFLRQESPVSFQQGDNGWSLIHVFYGNTSHIADNSFIPRNYFDSVQWFSQARQDEIVSHLLKHKRNGYYVDLAANDAVRISNTYALDRRYGWQGLCIEPNPMYWGGLSYRNCHVVGAVIGASNMQEIQFKYPNRAAPQGGIVGKQFDNKERSKFQEDHPRYTVTLLDVFERFGTPKVIDYLSLDVEGAEEFIMQAFPFEKYRINIMTVERPNDSLRALLEQNGYKFLKILKGNSGETIWAHQSQLNSLDFRALELDRNGYIYRDSDTSAYLTRPTFPP